MISAERSAAFAKLALRKGTADRRLVRFHISKDLGGYFCGLLLSLLPMAYPSPKAVRHKNEKFYYEIFRFY